MKTSPRIHRGPVGGGMSKAINPEMHDEVLVVGSSTFTIKNSFVNHYLKADDYLQNQTNYFYLKNVVLALKREWSAPNSKSNQRQIRNAIAVYLILMMKTLYC
jgi:hypothetical protein